MRARLCIENGEACPGELDLDPDQAVSLGRSRDSSIVLRDEHASRLHARLYFTEGRWYLRDFGMNGTLVNGERVQQQAELKHGNEIRVGNVRIRFSLLDGPGSTSTFRAHQVEKQKSSSSSSGSISISALRNEELMALTAFMASAAGQGDEAALLRQGLQLLLLQTDSAVVGCLAADPANPIPKLLLPESARVEPAMSRHLTRRTLRDGKMFWLGTDLADSRPTQALHEVTDALCLPLRAGGTPRWLLHLYKKGQFFSDRDVRIAEIIAEFLGGCLQGMRRERLALAHVARLTTHPMLVDEIIGDSPAMVGLRQQITYAAASQGAVLIHGELGTCAELVALRLHRSSSRAAGPFVTAPLSAVAAPLMESELFGKKHGTGELQPGLCHRADEGILYLDEITELPLDVQQRLVRLITDKTVKPVGAMYDARVDVRVVAATHSDFAASIASGRTSQEFAGHLGEIMIEIPPLRAHLEDIPYLVQYFLDRLALETRRNVTLNGAAIEKLCSYPWPGNLRQLRAELEAAVLRTERTTLGADDVLIG